MPTYVITAPDGNEYEVDAPEGASESAALEYFKANWKPEQPKERSWGNVAGQAILNAPKSVGGLVKGIAETVASPVQTAQGLFDIAAGGVQNILPKGFVDYINAKFPSKSAEEARAKADAVGAFYKDRYGSKEGLKNAIAEDPAGVLADAATVLTAGGGLAAKVPGLAKAGEAAVRAGSAIDPLMLSAKGLGKAAQYGGGFAANVIGGPLTHTGGESIKQAFKAGAEGGTKAAEFADNLRGSVPMTDVLDQAKAALDNIRKARSDEYKLAMQGVSADKRILKMQPIENAMNSALNVSMYKGKSLNRSTLDTQAKILDLVDEWKNSDPAEFHTAEGLDALKRAIGDVRQSTDRGTPSRVVADRVYNAVKGQIESQAKDYAKIMKDYEKASDLVREIEQSLVGGEKTSVSSAMAKLQKVMRNNAYSNYGQKVELAKELEKTGAPNLMSNLAGQALNTWTPRGLGNLQLGTAGGLGVMTGNPLAAAGMLAAQSPRLMGEAAFKLGQGKGMVSIPASMINDLAKQHGVNPALVANYLYQANQPKER